VFLLEVFRVILRLREKRGKRLMPMFDYRCKNCDEVFEELVSSSAIPDEQIKCPKCKKNSAKRLLSAPMVAMSSSLKTTSNIPTPPCGRSGFT